MSGEMKQNGMSYIMSLKDNNIPKRGEVWFIYFPLEEDNSKTLHRPVIVLEDNDKLVGILSIKVTKHKPRDEWDYKIFYWQDAKLRMKSTARVSKAIYLNLDAFDYKIGDLHPTDLKNVDKLFDKYLSELQKQNSN